MIIRRTCVAQDAKLFWMCDSSFIAVFPCDEEDRWRKVEDDWLHLWAATHDDVLVEDLESHEGLVPLEKYLSGDYRGGRMTLVVGVCDIGWDHIPGGACTVEAQVGWAYPEFTEIGRRYPVRVLSVSGPRSAAADPSINESDWNALLDGRYRGTVWLHSDNDGEFWLNVSSADQMLKVLAMPAGTVSGRMQSEKEGG